MYGDARNQAPLIRRMVPSLQALIRFNVGTVTQKKEKHMNTPMPHTSKSNLHPMMIAAAIAVILVCLAGTAAIMGWIPASMGGGTATGELTPSDRAALASRLADSDRPMTDTERDGERDRAMQLERERETGLRDRESDLAIGPAVEQRPMRLAQADSNIHQVASCSNCGRVTSVRTIKTRAQGSGVGAAGGAILGGLLGNQVGGGNGKKLATVAGAVGGAVVGNQVEGNMKATTSYEVHVRMDNGNTRTVQLQNLNGYNSGDRVKVVNGALRHAG